MVVLDELDALWHLFPELDVPVLRAGDEEVRAGSEDAVRHHIAVHVALLVHISIWERVDVDLFVLKPLPLLLALQCRRHNASRSILLPCRGPGGERRGAEVIIRFAVTLRTTPALAFFGHEYPVISNIGTAKRIAQDVCQYLCPRLREDHGEAYPP